MQNQVIVRSAVVSEHKQLEDLLWRASLNNPGDRDALLEHPDAIELPIDQIKNGDVFVAEVVGFCDRICRRPSAR
jgi:hypothetical protein